MGVPDLWVSGFNYLSVDWSQVDLLNNAYTCDELKALRDQNVSDSPVYCQKQSGKVDSDFPCVLALGAFNVTSPNCPGDCRTEINPLEIVEV